ncbi:hypothetical protein [Butyrivibrio fibrisolvens]|uniref:hypothetical protein n=1 Tax=Butyrivibrio fibrisolvens TaxID=831 RepID=UPI0003B67A77|nr:hypothetical protein [Butyrivibrio fibrisolvens]
MDKRLKKITVYDLFPLVAICIFIISFWNTNSLIKVLPDEYGYWAAGDWLSGGKWNALSSTIYYYGIGYGFILSGLLKLTFSAEISYHLAIIINGAMIYLMFWLYKVVLCRLGFGSTDSSIWAGCLAYMSANMYYLSFTLCEIMLAFVYALTVFFCWKYLSTTKDVFAYLALGLSIILVMIHMRTIGIAFYTLICMLFFSKKNKRLMVGLLVEFLLLLFCFVLLKGSYQNSHIIMLNQIAPEGVVDGNDVNHNLKKVIFLFSKTGITNFFLLLLGHMYYSFSASFCLLLSCLFLGLKALTTRMKEISKSYSIDDKMLFYTIGGFVAALLVSCLFSVDVDITDRFDMLTYSRYYEFCIAPAVIWGLDRIIKYNHQYKLFFMNSAVFCIMGMLTHYAQTYETNRNMMFLQCYLTKFYESVFPAYRNSFLLAETLVTLCVAFICALFLTIRRNAIVPFLLSIIYLCASFSVYYEWNNSWGSKYENEIKDCVRYLYESGTDSKILTIADTTLTYIYGVQFLLKDQSIEIVSDINDVSNEINPKIIVAHDELKNELVEEKYNRTFSGRVDVWER